jgi:hypothetical protein
MASELFIAAAQLFGLLGLGVGWAALLWPRLALPSAAFWLVSWGATCAVSYALFWVWPVAPSAAIWLTRIAWLASVAVFAHTAGRSCRERPWRAAPVAAFALLAVAAVLVHGAWPSAPAGRFTVALPSDDGLPRKLADRVEGAAGTFATLAAPLEGDSLTSDRPPLQAALVLAVRALAPSYRFRTYQSIGIACQASMVLALWLLCDVLELSRRARAFVLLAVCGTGFVLLNLV